MTRQTQTILYHLLPVTFWLLAIGGMVLWEILTPCTLHFTSYIPALLALLAAIIIRHIPRHQNAVEPCFQMALLLGIAAYWLPSILFLIIPIWGYLIYRTLLDFRSILATFIGLATVAIWIAVLTYFYHTPYTFHIAYNVRLWIPTGAILIAWLASTIVRQNLRER